MEPDRPGCVCVAVVDDDDNLRRSFARLLRAAGMQAKLYASAERFLAEEAHGGFDCLVLDVQLGGISGLELQTHLRSVRDSTPVVFITAYDDPSARDRAYAGGCAAYFLKSDPGGDVLAAIRHVVEARSAGR